MSQTKKFWKYHGENGLKFKKRIIDAGLIDNRVGFPISAVDDELAVELYTNYINAKLLLKYYIRINRTSKGMFDTYKDIKQRYLQHVLQYHREPQ